MASLVLLVVDTGAALQPAIVRFKGVEENPDTLPLLAAYALPLAAWRVRAGAGAERWLAATEILAVLLVLGASGSRGGLVAGTAGLLVYAWAELGTRLRTVAAAAAIVVVCGATLAITPLLVHLPGARPYVPPSSATTTVTGSSPSGAPGSASAGTVSAGTTTTTTTTAADDHDDDTVRSSGPRRSRRRGSAPRRYFPGAMADELGRQLTLPVNVSHPLFSSSGRVAAWVGAIKQADQRPLLGYGFGTEDVVFIDRYFSFEGGRPENSIIGLYLQLGIVGVVCLLALLLFVAVCGLKALLGLPRGRRGPVAALAGVAAGGALEMLVQSYALSAGDIAMLSFWICAGLFSTSSEWMRA